MSKSRVVKRGNTTQKLLKKLKSLNKEAVAVGHFSEQGLHYSGMTYPDLMNLWARGGPDPSNPRFKSPREALRANLREVLNNPRLKEAFYDWIKTAEKDENSEQLLESFARHLKMYYQDLFGVVGPFMTTDRTGTPLLETGDLKAQVAFKTSKNTSLRK